MKKHLLVLLSLLTLAYAGLSLATCIEGNEAYYRKKLTQHQWLVRDKEVTTSEVCTTDGCHTETRTEFTGEISYVQFKANGIFNITEVDESKPGVILDQIHGHWRLSGNMLIMTLFGDTVTITIKCAGDDKIVTVDEDGDEDVMERA